MKNDAANTRSRSRTRRKPAAPVAPAPAAVPPPPENPRNVGALESVLSLVLGVLFVIGALFPRSFKQLFLLGVGGGLVYRGLTSHCGLYTALGLDTEKGSLLQQVSEKYLSGPADKGAEV